MKLVRLIDSLREKLYRPEHRVRACETCGHTLDNITVFSFTKEPQKTHPYCANCDEVYECGE